MVSKGLKMGESAAQTTKGEEMMMMMRSMRPEVGGALAVSSVLNYFIFFYFW